MHIITHPSTGEGRNVGSETNASASGFDSTSDSSNNNNSTVIINNNNNSLLSSNDRLPWYMGQWTTPVTAVLEAYVLISLLIFFVMFMLCIHRHGCCHMFHHRRRRHRRQRQVRYQQQMRVRAWEDERAAALRDEEDEDVNIDGLDGDSIDTENGGRVQEIQRLERALRTAGIA